MDPHDAGRTARSLETLHALGYFAPEVEAELTGLGLRKGRMGYFASRSAPMGRVGPGTVAATFYVFNPDLVAHFLPAAWDAAEPADVVAARYRGVPRPGAGSGVSAAWRGSRRRPARLGRGGGGRRAGPSRRRRLHDAGRPLSAAHADLAWPEEPHLVLFHALTVVREHRGDGHIAALLTAELSGIEALVSHTATGRGFTEPAAKATRGWSDEQWAEAEASLADRGYLDGDGAAPGSAARPCSTPWAASRPC